MNSENETTEKLAQLDAYYKEQIRHIELLGEAKLLVIEQDSIAMQEKNIDKELLIAKKNGCSKEEIEALILQKKDLVQTGTELETKMVENTAAIHDSTESLAELRMQQLHGIKLALYQFKEMLHHVNERFKQIGKKAYLNIADKGESIVRNAYRNNNETIQKHLTQAKTELDNYKEKTKHSLDVKNKFNDFKDALLNKEKNHPQVQMNKQQLTHLHQLEKKVNTLTEELDEAKAKLNQSIARSVERGVQLKMLDVNTLKQEESIENIPKEEVTEPSTPDVLPKDNVEPEDVSATQNLDQAEPHVDTNPDATGPELELVDIPEEDIPQETTPENTGIDMQSFKSVPIDERINKASYAVARKNIEKRTEELRNGLKEGQSVTFTFQKQEVTATKEDDYMVSYMINGEYVDDQKLAELVSQSNPQFTKIIAEQLNDKNENHKTKSQEPTR